MKILALPDFFGERPQQEEWLAVAGNQLRRHSLIIELPAENSQIRSRGRNLTGCTNE